MSAPFHPSPHELNQAKTCYGSWHRAERDRRFIYERQRNSGGHIWRVYASRHGGFTIGTRDRLDIQRQKRRAPIA